MLRRHVADESVDLVYLDPPFKSDQDYNVLFAEHGIKAAAQIKAFEDTWRWDETAARAFEETVEGGGRVADALRAFLDFAPARRSPMEGAAPSAPGAGVWVRSRQMIADDPSAFRHLDWNLFKYAALSLKYKYGAEAPLFQLVDHQWTLGITVKAAKK